MILTKEAGMKCKMCGRVLKNTMSRQAGYGPVCYRKMFGKYIYVRSRERSMLKQHETTTGDNTYCWIPGQMKVDDYLQFDEIV
jgi:hypothetical protein